MEPSTLGEHHIQPCHCVRYISTRRMAFVEWNVQEILNLVNVSAYQSIIPQSLVDR